MPVIKKEGFNPPTIELAKLMKALGHPARVAIIELLLERQTCVCGSIVDALPLSQATVSQHLAALKEAGLVQGTIEGPRVCYCIHPENWEAAMTMVKAFLGRNPSAGKCC